MLGANAPEVTSSVTALLRGERDVGVGVIIGSNVFNLAALLGLAAVISGRIRFHRRVVVLAGTVGVSLLGRSVWSCSIGLSSGVGLVLGLVIFAPYLLVTGAPSAQRRDGFTFRSGLAHGCVARSARRNRSCTLRSTVAREIGGMPRLVRCTVVAASAVMERSASSLGTDLGLSSIVIGGIVLAAVTSLPNAVAAVYLASRGRGSAVLSEALNSTLKCSGPGLLIPVTILGSGHPGIPALVSTGWFVGLTLFSLGGRVCGARPWGAPRVWRSSSDT